MTDEKGWKDPLILFTRCICKIKINLNIDLFYIGLHFLVDLRSFKLDSPKPLLTSSNIIDLSK